MDGRSWGTVDRKLLRKVNQLHRLEMVMEAGRAEGMAW